MALWLRTKSKLNSEFPRQADILNWGYYQSIRDEMKTGDLLFFSGDHWLSSLIRWRSVSAWSHMGIVIRIDEIDRIFLAESTLENGVRLVPMSYIYKDYDGHNKPYKGRVAWGRHFLLEKSQEKQNLIMEFCLDILTKQYDRREYWWILWRTFIGSKEIIEDDKFTCAEYVWEAFKYAKIELPKERGFFISPGAFGRQEATELKAVLI